MAKGRGRGTVGAEAESVGEEARGSGRGRVRAGVEQGRCSSKGNVSGRGRGDVLVYRSIKQIWPEWLQTLI